MIKFLVSVWLKLNKPKPPKKYTIVQFDNGYYGAFRKTGLFEKEWVVDINCPTLIDFYELNEVLSKAYEWNNLNQQRYVFLCECHKQKLLENSWTEFKP